MTKIIKEFTEAGLLAALSSFVVADVRRYNQWRRGDDEIEMPPPKSIGESLDAICDLVENLIEKYRMLHAEAERITTEHHQMAMLAQNLQRERDDARKIIDDIDEIFFTMRPRHVVHPSMDGGYPCWIVWLPEQGQCERKSLSDAVREFMAQTLILPGEDQPEMTNA